MWEDEKMVLEVTELWHMPLAQPSCHSLVPGLGLSCSPFSGGNSNHGFGFFFKL